MKRLIALLVAAIVGAVAIGFVDDEDVGDLEDAGLRHLHGVTGAGRPHDPGLRR